MTETLKNWFIKQQLSETLATYASWALLAVAVIIVAVLVNFIVKRILLKLVTYFIKITRTKWDDALLKNHVFTRLSHLAPALVIYACATLFEHLQILIERLSFVYMLMTGLSVLFAFLNAAGDIYRSYEVSRQKPVKGYIQVVKIILTVFVVIIAIATLLNQNPLLLLSGLGAMTAVLILVFKDSILGFVASVQLTTNDMVRIGDWIEMPKYDADGEVIDVTLHFIKVQNWDKTIVTIPAYALISESFKNWRGMSESGGRRIKRAINIDMTSVKFCSPEMLKRFEKFQLITEYIRSKLKEIAEYNKVNNIDTSELINGRNLTNLGTFRAYIKAYLENHPKIHKDMTFLVRHLPPGEHGLPIEIYVFSNDQVWANYEALQADIFDHILAVVPMFDLRVFQQPTGNDLKRLTAAD
ncbi:MAG: mechanosensitive ion channel family protein [Candidatus Zixiibacteriota bacterium]